MSSRPDPIIPNRELTAQEIQDYHAGKLSEVEKNLVERIAASSPMSQAALDAGADASAMAALDSVKSTVSKQTGFQSATWFKLAGLTAIAAIVAFVVFKREEVLETQQPIAKQESILPSPEEDPELDNTLEEELSPITIHSSKTTDSSVSFVVSLPEEVRHVLDDHFVTIEPVEDLEALDPLFLEEFEEEIPEEPIELGKPESSHRIYFIQDYKLVDYRGLREKGIELLNHSLGGVSAQFGSEEEQEQAPEQLNQIAYVDYLNQAMVDFSTEKLRRASRKFEIILETYPDDVNALFYGGLCDFHLSKHEPAAEKLKKVASHQFSTFDEDAEFYGARSVLQFDEELAAEMLRQIVGSKGYYAEQAQSILDKL